MNPSDVKLKARALKQLQRAVDTFNQIGADVDVDVRLLALGILFELVAHDSDENVDDALYTWETGRLIFRDLYKKGFALAYAGDRPGDAPEHREVTQWAAQAFSLADAVYEALEGDSAHISMIANGLLIEQTIERALAPDGPPLEKTDEEIRLGMADVWREGRHLGAQIVAQTRKRSRTSRATRRSRRRRRRKH